jgi:hypothetical protein
MSDQASGSEQSNGADWRLKLGAVLFLFSIVLPLLGIPVVAAMEFTNAITATISGVLLVGAEVIGVAAIAVMGKSGYDFIKERVLLFLNRHGPPETVSRRRYTMGLIVFSAPILFAWLSIYLADWIPGFVNNPLPYALFGDTVLLISLFVLGGEFWDKIRALFIYDAKASFSKPG